MTQESGRIWVMGGRPLNGTAAVPAAKNSVLPLLAAALLCRGTVRLRAVPALSDVECCLALLRGAGCDARRQGADVVVSGTPVCSTLPGDAAARMRASILFCAPLLARLGRAETSLPGGCPMAQVPDWLYRCNILMDFLRDDRTCDDLVSCRMLEYRATGRPVVSMLLPDQIEPLPDVVYGAHSDQEFLTLCRHALDEPPNFAAQRRRDRAEAASWPLRCTQVVNILTTAGLL